MWIALIPQTSCSVPCLTVKIEIIPCVQVLSFRILERENFFIEKFKAIGLDTKLCDLHSLRIGGASAATNNDLPDRVIKKHGRWKSEKAKDTYCREDIQHQLLVTLNIGI